MFRYIIEDLHRHTPSYFAAAVAMNTGVGVVVDEIAATCDLPDAAITKKGFYVVDLPHDVYSCATAKATVSDWATEYNVVAANQLVKLHQPAMGEIFATDQVDDPSDFGATAAYAQIGTNGKFALSESATEIQYVGSITEAGGKLYQFKVL